MGLKTQAVASQFSSIIRDRVFQVNDQYSYQAVEAANNETHRVWVKALVHRDEGLYVLDGYQLVIHFNSALCGYRGTAPITTAEILESFGFGTKKAIYEKINFGGDDACFLLDVSSGSLEVTSVLPAAIER